MGILKENQEFILEEIDRTNNNLERKIDKVNQRLEEIDQFYRIRKLEDDNTVVLTRGYYELSERVEKLERRMA